MYLRVAVPNLKHRSARDIRLSWLSHHLEKGEQAQIVLVSAGVAYFVMGLVSSSSVTGFS